MLTYTTECLTSQRTINKRTPNPCVRVVYIAGDTLRHQPMGAGHMTVLQLRGPIGSCVLPWWLFIAGDTLCQHPMGTGHMTVLQLCGLMEFRVLQWCHPMLASTRRTSCCTRIITLYGTRKWIQARTESQASSQSCRSVDADAWYKRGLSRDHVSSGIELSSYHHEAAL